jgi:type I restriction enzyme M protein
MVQNNTKQEALNKKLWNAADKARGKIEASVYKDYILVMLFLKYISDLFELEKKEIIARYGNDKEILKRRLEKAKFNIPEGCSFNELYAKRTEKNIGELVNMACAKIENQNLDKLENVITGVDFNSESVFGKGERKSAMIEGMLETFNGIDFELSDHDLIGSAYMYLIERFGAEAGKKAGEFFTPANVSLLLAKLADPKPGITVYDPACGSGGLLNLVGNGIREKFNKHDYVLYGQEAINTTFNLARMNMYLHGEMSAQIKQGDTLNEPMFIAEDGHIQQFDLIVANPPFSLKDWMGPQAENDKYGRFHRGLPPKSKGDFAFISHMVESAKDKTGKVAVIVPHGVLFRGSAEGTIRKALINENLLDAVIGLPAGLFQTTGIPVAILIFDKSRQKGGVNENRKDILFVDASKEFKPGKKQNTIEAEHMGKILDVVLNRRGDVERFSNLVDLAEIEENDFNLNIPRYVDTFEPEEEVDLKENLAELATLEEKIKVSEAKIAQHLAKFEGLM